MICYTLLLRCRELAIEVGRGTRYTFECRVEVFRRLEPEREGYGLDRLVGVREQILCAPQLHQHEVLGGRVARVVAEDLAEPRVAYV